MTWFLVAVLVVVVGFLVYQTVTDKLESEGDLHQVVGRLDATIETLTEELTLKNHEVSGILRELEATRVSLQEEKQKSAEMLSQKTSQAVRTGQIVEQMVPFLEQFPHDPKNCHFVGQPFDYLVVDLDQGEIIILEIKSGNAKESPRQKKIKNIIKNGKVYYEQLRVDGTGVKVKREVNNE